MTTRDLTSGMSTGLQASVVRPFFLVEGEFVSGGSPAYVRYWTGYGSLSWDSKTWSGGGNLLSFSPIRETLDIEATGFAITLSGQNSSSIAVALGACRQGKPGRIWFGLMDENNSIILSPYLMREGRLDVPTINDDGKSCRITVTYEDRNIRLKAPRERRYTTEDQHIDYSSDKGFDFVPALQNATDLWGRK